MDDLSSASAKVVAITDDTVLSLRFEGMSDPLDVSTDQQVGLIDALGHRQARQVCELIALVLEQGKPLPRPYWRYLGDSLVKLVNSDFQDAAAAFRTKVLRGRQDEPLRDIRVAQLVESFHSSGEEYSLARSERIAALILAALGDTGAAKRQVSAEGQITTTRVRSIHRRIFGVKSKPGRPPKNGI